VHVPESDPASLPLAFLSHYAARPNEGESNGALHLQKHLLDICQPQLAVVVLLQRMKLHCGDPIGLDGVVTTGEE
jgi:hypothetical protein